MVRKCGQQVRAASCSLCGTAEGPLTRCEGGHLCDACVERALQGRDSTTRAIKSMQRALRGQAQASRIRHNGGEVDEQLDYSIAASELLEQETLLPDRAPERGAGGEVLPEHDLALRDTLAAPGAAALDASAHRLELVTSLGNDTAALALDMADSIGASNSLERMYSHQLAVLHRSAMQMVAKASLEADAVTAMRMMNLGIRAAEVFQRGATNLKRLRGTGQQVVRVEHVHVAPGAQAIVGHVQTGRGGK